MPEYSYSSQKKNKKVVTYLVLILFLILMIAGIVLSNQLCRIKNIIVTGSERYEKEDLILVSGIEMDRNIFTLSGYLVKNKIVEQFPYIRNVRVHRILPDTVELKLTEEIGRYAFMSGTERYTLVSNEGRILEQVLGKKPTAFYRIYAGDYSEYDEGVYLSDEDIDIIKRAQEMTTAMESTNAEKINYIDMTDQNCIWVLYDQRIMVKFGTELDAEYKFRVIKEIAGEELAEDYTGVLDVTISGKAYAKEGSIADKIQPSYQLEIITK